MNLKENVVIEHFRCYKENYLRKQILLFIISLVIFFIAFTIGMSTIDFNAPLKKDVAEFANINLLQIQFIFVMILTPFLALIPFVKKLSIVTIFYSYFMAFNVTNMFYLPTCNEVLLAFSVVLSLLALSMNLVLSFELSERITRKFATVINLKNNSKSKKIIKNKENEKNDKEANIGNVFIKEQISLNLKRNVTIILVIICMLVTIVNLIVTKFI